MREFIGNLWTINASVRIIPTNGVVTTAGHAVMGKGVAAQACERFPMLPQDLGKQLRKHGNHVFFFDQYRLITFPTKHHWRENATVDLLKQSVRELLKFLDPNTRYAMPRVGAGLGGLHWESQVRPLLVDLPDNVTIVHLQR